MAYGSERHYELMELELQRVKAEKDQLAVQSKDLIRLNGELLTRCKQLEKEAIDKPFRKLSTKLKIQYQNGLVSVPRLSTEDNVVIENVTSVEHITGNQPHWVIKIKSSMAEHLL